MREFATGGLGLGEETAAHAARAIGDHQVGPLAVCATVTGRRIGAGATALVEAFGVAG